MARDDWASSRLMRDRRSPRKGKRGRGGKTGDRGRSATAGGCGSRAGSTWSTGSTATGLLPAIVFIFSRVGCDAAVKQCLQREPAADDP